MKKYILLTVVAAVVGLCSVSCSKDELSSQSVITVDSNVSNTPFDQWLRVNYLLPYNIDFKWRYEDKETDMDFYTVPAEYNKAVKMAHLVKYLCLEAYDEVAGVDFTRAYFPKMIFTIGQWEFQNNGTFILGTAEGGRKILLTGINDLDLHIDNPDELNHYYFKTIHHEFTHILNQTKDYSADFKLITGNGYVADMWSESPYNGSDTLLVPRRVGGINNTYAFDTIQTTYYLKHGFISAYAQMEHVEDFAEMMSMYICYSPSQWAEWMRLAGTDGAAKLQAKLDVVKDYMQTVWNIDLDALRSTIQRRQKEISENKVDLSDLTVE